MPGVTSVSRGWNSMAAGRLGCSIRLADRRRPIVRAVLAALLLLPGGCNRSDPDARADFIKIGDAFDPAGVLDKVAKALDRGDEQVAAVNVLYYPLQGESQVPLTPESLQQVAIFEVTIRPEESPPSLASAIRATRVNRVRDSAGSSWDLRWRLRVVLRGYSRPLDIFVNDRGAAGYVAGVPVTFTGNLPEWLKNATVGLTGQ